MFARVRFVLVETSHPGNVGSVARAIKTMGFGSLVLVSPREPAVREHRTPWPWPAAPTTCWLPQ
ncbi:TrmH family RNA methyltransferase [Cupriavidus basilensis]